MRNCVDIVRPFIAEMAEHHPEIEFQVVGGTGSAALALADTFILPADGIVETPSGLNVPQFRDEKRRNKRDLDLLVLTTSATAVEQITAVAGSIIGKDLKKSVFELKPASVLRHQQGHPFVPNMKSFLSDRYVEEVDGQVTELWKGLYPFLVSVDVATLETYHLHVDGDDVLTPIPHPGSTLLNYLTRSISGIRPKDEEKLLGTRDKKGIAEVVLGDPELKQWVLDGPGKNLFYLARVLHGLRQPVDNQKPLRLTDDVSLDPINPRTLPFDSRVFVFATELADLPAGSARALRMAQMKSRVVHKGESNKSVVNTWQKFMEGIIGKIIHNN